ncbi:hypothetical protein PRIPAC_85179 [Pristionchus pacificus]|uniref:P-type Cu(+) transporter n=1 Tax=Pristionchus pacificus TaxID=54126 RepID=A0A2A6BMH6_PRIPA|nr:hypothetical protein PRIPAC_85179 [Pristionchus pacificus]|eukprot:PDM67048.1 hydrolase [Pristionchus pacificus]
MVLDRNRGDICVYDVKKCEEPPQHLPPPPPVQPDLKSYRVPSLVPAFVTGIKEIEWGSNSSKKPWSGRRKIHASDIRDMNHARELSASSLVEHRLNIDQIRDIHPQSSIDVDDPELSEGLTREEAKNRLAEGGTNKIDPPKDPHHLMVFLSQFHSKLWIIQTAAAILSIVAFIITHYRGHGDVLNLYSAAILFIVVGSMYYLSYRQERKARGFLQTFEKKLPEKAIVIRDGDERPVEVEQLVVGDIVVIRCGSRIPADLRILKSKGLIIQSAEVTGNEMPIECTAEMAASGVTALSATNLAFKGSYCIEGDGIGIVLRVGKYTVLGGIAQTHQHIPPPRGKLETELSQFVHFILLLAVFMATTVFLIGCYVTSFQNTLDHFMYGFIVIVVANIPQGLPATVMCELEIIARKLSQKNVCIKRLELIDELGAATVICSDKTGTLTMNEMAVTDVWYNRRLTTADRRLVRTAQATAGYLIEKPLPDILTVMCVCNRAQQEHGNRAARRKHSSRFPIPTRASSEAITTIGPSFSASSLTTDMERGGVRKKFTVCDPETGTESTAVMKRISSNMGHSEASQEFTAHQHPSHGQLHPRKKKKARIIGSASDVALAEYVELYASLSAIRERYHIVYEVPFNSVRRWQLVVARCLADTQGGVTDHLPTPPTGQSRFVVMMKGAPEVILARCARRKENGDVMEIDEGFANDCQSTWESLGNEGRRVIAFAHRHFNAPSDTRFDGEGAGLWKEGGLTFLGMAAIMDPPRPESAQAIKQCKEAGIKVFVITGDHPTTAKALAVQIGLISGRVDNPNKDWTVVTGDQLNEYGKEEWDALLKHRYIVFARTNPEQKMTIVQECQKRDETVAVTGGGMADIVLLDDNFATIVSGIEEGRLLFDNLRLSLAYTFAHLWPEVFPIMLTYLVGVPRGLSQIQILSIDLASEMPPAISLAYEQPEKDIMKRPPRSRKSKLLSKSLLFYSYIVMGTTMTCGCFLAYMSVFWYHGIVLTDIVFTAEQYWKEGAENFTTVSGNITLSVTDQLKIKGEAAAAWQITLVLAQVFHLYNCTTRRISIFSHGIGNVISVFATIIEVLLLVTFVYTSGPQYILEISPPPAHVWGIAPVVGVVILVYNEVRKYVIRNHPTWPMVKVIKW